MRRASPAGYELTPEGVFLRMVLTRWFPYLFLAVGWGWL